MNPTKIALLACLMAGSLFGQIQNQYTYSNRNPAPNAPSNSCYVQTTPVYNYLTGTYWYCVPNSSNPYALGAWTSYTYPNGILAGNGAGQDTLATSAQMTTALGSGGTAGTAFSNVVQDTGPIPVTLTQLQTLNSVGLTVIPAKGTGTLIVPGSCTLELIHGSAAFTGGGTVTIGYGATSSPATNGTIASTVFTTFTASQAVTVLPVALPVTATATGLLNTGIVMTAASADFAAGTGGSGVLDCQYRVIGGLQ